MKQSQIEFFKKWKKLIILLLIILPIGIFNTIFVHYTKIYMSPYICLYISVLHGFIFGYLGEDILSPLYDEWLAKKEFINFCREREKEIGEILKNPDHFLINVARQVAKMKEDKNNNPLIH
jgi:hypothetical protein